MSGSAPTPASFLSYFISLNTEIDSNMRLIYNSTKIACQGQSNNYTSPTVRFTRHVIEPFAPVALIPS
jgi:hypothetical protein